MRFMKIDIFKKFLLNSKKNYLIDDINSINLYSFFPNHQFINIYNL